MYKVDFLHDLNSSGQDRYDSTKIAYVSKMTTPEVEKYIKDK